MAEPRRVHLSCLPPTPPVPAAAPKRPRSADQDPEPQGTTTVRIALSLFEPDQKKCPEFCYPDLLKNLQNGSKKNAAGDKSQKKPFHFLGYEEAERKEVENLAQKFEVKYGNKKCKDRVQDLIDMGYGYDESDSFIDNSEAYDELVPASLTTKYGGFYINSGTLQFRQASESEDEVVKKKKKKSPKKMKERGDKVKKRKREEDRKGKKSKHPKLGFTALNGTKEKKKKRNPASYKEMLAKFQREKESEKKKLSASAPPAAPIPPPPPAREAKPTPDPPSPATGPAETRVKPNNSLSQKVPDKPPDAPAEKGGGCPGPEKPSPEPRKPSSIPEGLPAPLEKQITELTKAVRMSKGDTNVLFTPEVNTALLDICLLSRDLSSVLRAAVFNHLASVLPCSKDTLMKWAARLYMQKQGGRLQEPLKKLREAVAKAMPEQINKYHEECKVYNKAKYAKMLEDKDQRGHSEEEEEEDKAGKKAAGPRKKFQWSDEIRQLLCQLVRVKVELCEKEGSGVPSLEDYFKTFLDVEVKPLWPRGWMQARTLYKESRRLYPQLSVIMTKNKVTNPPKAKVKEPPTRLDKNVSPTPAETQGTVTTTPASAKDTSVPSSVLSPPVNLQDNSLDGDLILHPPSLDAVSEHLTALASRTSGVSFDFSAPNKPSPPSAGEKAAPATEERKKTCPPSPLAPGTRTAFAEQPSVGLERRLPVHNPKPAPEVKAKPSPAAHQHGPIKAPQIVNPSLQPSVKLYQMNSQYNKGGFPHAIQNPGPKAAAPSPPQRPLTPQTKPSKPQTFPPSPAGSKHKPVASAGFVGKHGGPAAAQIYRPPVPRLPAPPHSNQGAAPGPLNPPAPALSRNLNAAPAKKHPQPPHRLTLMAPQESGGFGVAKLLTSSIVSGVEGKTTTSPIINQSQKGGAGPGLLGASPSLIVMAPSYKANGGKLPGTLDLLSTMHSLPLHVSSFTAVPAPKPGASKDAIVTGPAPGTFNHGLPRTLLSGLHANTAHRSNPIPHPALSGTMQPSQTDGAHVQGKGTSTPQRKL